VVQLPCMNRCDECRRDLLRAGVAGAVALVAPGCGSPAGRSERDGGAASDGGPGEDANGANEGGPCSPSCAQGPKTLAFPFSTYPQLRAVGGSAMHGTTGYADPSCRLGLVVVAQPSAGTFVAFSAACPHQCCVVSFIKARNEFVCPCHGSTFDLSGRVVVGPAPSGLQELSVCADSCGVYVTTP